MRLCHEIAEKTSAICINELNGSSEEFNAISIEYLDKAIFESSLSEGALEVDVIERIYAIKQRIALHREIARDARLIDKLTRIRRLRSAGFSVGTFAPDGDSIKKIQAWRRAEVVTDGALINGLHSPLSCGDVFQREGGAKRFILLRQPCDLMVRGEGRKRVAQEAIFVLLREDVKREKHLKESQFRLDGAGENGRDWLVDFRTSGFVDLSVLDFAVFSETGAVEFSLYDVASPLLLPGVQKLFTEAMNRLAVQKEKWVTQNRLSQSESIPEREAKWKDGEKMVRFGYKRVARVNQPWAQAILASFAAYHTRAALDGNFATSFSAVVDLS